MVGLDRRTGKRISNLESAYQAVTFTLSTRIGDVILLREFGGGVVELLGRAMTPALFAAWKQLIAHQSLHLTGTLLPARFGASCGCPSTW